MVLPQPFLLCLIVLTISKGIPINLKKTESHLNENVVFEKRRPPVMFVNSGLVGGGSKPHIFKHSNAYRSENELDRTQYYRMRNTNFMDNDIPFSRFLYQTRRPGLNSIPVDTTHKKVYKIKKNHRIFF